MQKNMATTKAAKGKKKKGHETGKKPKGRGWRTREDVMQLRLAVREASGEDGEMGFARAWGGRPVGRCLNL